MLSWPESIFAGLRMRKRRRRPLKQPQSPSPSGPLWHPRSPQLQLPCTVLQLLRPLLRGHLQPAPRSLQRLRLLRCDNIFRQPPRPLRLPFDLPRHPRRGLRLRLARRPLQEQLRHSHLRPARCVRLRLLRLPRLALPARRGPQVRHRQDNPEDSLPHVLVKASAKLGRALLRGCALRLHRVNLGPVAHRDLLARRHQDFRSDRAPGVPVRRPLEVSVPAQRAFQVYPRQNQESPYTSENRLLHADVRPSKNAMPRVSAGCTRFERAPVPARDARLTLSRWPLCNASRGT